MNELELLFENREFGLSPWVIGKIPHHFKRLSVSKKEGLRLARKGASEMAAAYGIKLFYCQAMIAGAILDPKYDEIVVVTPSQYGKSWLLGHVALYRAYNGAKQYIAGAAANVTGIIMGQTIAATAEASPEMKNALMVKKDEIDRLTTQMSKQRLAYASGGFVEAITLGDTYTDSLVANKAVGRAGDFFVDEAALLSDKNFVEMGRREFARIDGSKYKMVMISNPHRPGMFYDKLTQENPPKGTFILWIDSLTAVEEERFTEETVFQSDFAQNKSTRRRYLMCVLDTDGGGMFDVPETYKGHYEGDYTQWFMGVDAAYKGKDNIEVALTAAGDGKFHVDECIKIEKKQWIDGVTSEDIIKQIARLALSRGVGCVCVDEGWGVWLKEGLIRYGVKAIGVNFNSSPTKDRVGARHYAATNASNKRAEMHLDLQDLIEHQAIDVSEEVYSKIKDTLPLITCERKSNGKIQVIPKPAIKAMLGRSPDELDAVLLSIQAAIRFMRGGEYAIP